MSAPTDWFDALGRDVPLAHQQRTHKLLVDEGFDPTVSGMIVVAVAREIRHDEPDRAQRILRNWLPQRGSEVLLFRILATLVAPRARPLRAAA